MILKYIFITLCISFTLAALAIIFGKPGKPEVAEQINEAFKHINYASLPDAKTFTARDNTALTYRAYQASPENPKNQNIIFIHGSSADSISMHTIAQAFANAGFNGYTLDIRGHGSSDQKGTIDYIGQLEDDLVDFVNTTINDDLPTTLLGFSSGGGFTLRFASSRHQSLFKHYILLAPYLGHTASVNRPESGKWVKIGLPRIIALSILNRIGITVFNDLPVIRFALNEEAKKRLTPAYSFALMQNFQPNINYKSDITHSQQPMLIIAGEQDEIFYAEKYQDEFEHRFAMTNIQLLPDMGHIDLITNPQAIHKIIDAFQKLNES